MCPGRMKWHKTEHSFRGLSSTRTCNGSRVRNFIRSATLEAVHRILDEWNHGYCEFALGRRALLFADTLSQKPLQPVLGMIKSIPLRPEVQRRQEEGGDVELWRDKNNVLHANMPQHPDSPRRSMGNDPPAEHLSANEEEEGEDHTPIVQYNFSNG